MNFKRRGFVSKIKTTAKLGTLEIISQDNTKNERKNKRKKRIIKEKKTIHCKI